MGAADKDATTALAVTEQPQQLITIEPEKYVALVFEPFSKRLADAKAAVATVEFDVTTTAGMATAIKHRATFREIRVESEKARKVRKAPILEIGKLLDSRQKELEADIEPFESRFDSVIKAEEARKEAEKAAKAAAEKARVDAIRAKIERIKDALVSVIGKSAKETQETIDKVFSLDISLDEYAELTGEAQMVRAGVVNKLEQMHEEAATREAEAARIEQERAEAARRQAEESARLARERAELEQQRKEQAERERVAAAARAEEERKARVAREAEEAEARRLRQIEEDKLAAQRAEIAAAQAEIDRQRAEAERVERERQEAIAAAAKLESDHAAALIENARIDSEAAERHAETQREIQRMAEVAEQLRRERENFEVNGPAPDEIVAAVASQFNVTNETALGWMNRHVWAEVEIVA